MPANMHSQKAGQHQQRIPRTSPMQNAGGNTTEPGRQAISF